MEYVLAMTFLTEKGQKCAFNINGVKPDLTSTDINTLMDDIVSSKVFRTNSGDIVKKFGAHVTTKDVQKIEITH